MSYIKNKIPVLIYHDVIHGDYKKKYTIDIEQFERQIKAIKDRENNTIVAEDWNDIKKKYNENKICLLTFDDGLVSNYHIAKEYLRRYNMIATFFVVTDWIGLNGYMSWENLREMNRMNMSIQSHTKTHKYLKYLNKKELKDELFISKECIEQKLGKKVDSISLPYGDCNEIVIKKIFECGYQKIFTSMVGYANYSNSVVPRINIDYRVNLKAFKRIIDKKKWPLSKYKIVQIFKEKAKNLISFHK